MRHVALLTPRALYPERSGGEIRVATLLRRLSDRWRFTVLTLAAPDARLSAEAAAAFVERRTGARVRLAWRTPGAAASADLPAIAHDHADPALARALASLADEDPVDLVALEFTQLAQYAQAASRLAPVVLTEHDASILRPADSYLRGAAAAPDQRARVERHLRAAFSHCARVVAVSEADAARLAPLAGAGKVAVVPTGVDLERFAAGSQADRRPGEAAFVGHYPHYPNEEAAVRLCRDILPLILKRAPVRLRLVGSAPTPAVRALAGPAVEVVGEVEDVAPELRRASVFLAPMRLGFGIKGKVLEAFACGTPVVASPRACEAMPGLVPGTHLLVGRDARSFAAAAARVLQDASLAARLSAAARAYAQARFAWAAQADRLDAVYRAAVGEGRPCPV